MWPRHPRGNEIPIVSRLKRLIPSKVFPIDVTHHEAARHKKHFDGEIAFIHACKYGMELQDSSSDGCHPPRLPGLITS
jgi:hypothetical protein